MEYSPFPSAASLASSSKASIAGLIFACLVLNSSSNLVPEYPSAIKSANICSANSRLTNNRQSDRGLDMPGNPGAFSLLGNPVGDGAGHKAVRLDAAVIAAGPDPADQLRDQFFSFTIRAVAGIHMDRDRTVQVHFLILPVAFHDPYQLLGNLQAVICLHMELCPDISKVTVERTLTDLVKSGYIAKVGAGPSTAYVRI